MPLIYSHSSPRTVVWMALVAAAMVLPQQPPNLLAMTVCQAVFVDREPQAEDEITTVANSQKTSNTLDPEEKVTSDTDTNDDDDTDVYLEEDKNNFREFFIVNQASARMELYWLDTVDHQLELEDEDPILPGAMYESHSEIGTIFEVWEQPQQRSSRKSQSTTKRSSNEQNEDGPDPDSTTTTTTHEKEEQDDATKDETICPHAPHGECRGCTFTVSDTLDQVITITPDFECHVQDARTEAHAQASAMMEDCLATLQKEWHEQKKDDNDNDNNNQAPSTKTDSYDLDTLLRSVAECAQRGIGQMVGQLQEEIAFEAQLRSDMAVLAQDYMCQDTAQTETTEYEYHLTWTYVNGDNDDDEHNVKDPSDQDTNTIKSTKSSINATKYNVEIHLDEFSAGIRRIEQFVTDNECAALLQQQQAQQQAQNTSDISMPTILLEDNNDNNPIIKGLVERMYAYSNAALPQWNLTPQGQEPLRLVEYGPSSDGQIVQDVLPRYSVIPPTTSTVPSTSPPTTIASKDQPKHQPYTPGHAVATMLLYCQVPEEGGHEHFVHAGVHIPPKQGDALLVSYVDPQKAFVGNAFLTEHAMCPIVQGRKRMIMHRMRAGVSDSQPYSYFDQGGSGALPPSSSTTLDPKNQSTNGNDENDQKGDKARITSSEDTMADPRASSDSSSDEL